jgi:RNA polymerase sigma factor (sigma-70 family)
MAMPPAGGRLRVLVAADHALFADTVRAALEERGHQVVEGDRASADVGLMMNDLDRWSRIDSAAATVAGVGVPWLVLTSAPRGPAWGALLYAGADLVVPREHGLEQVCDLLVSLISCRSAMPEGERAELQAAWSEAFSRRHAMVGRLARLSPREGEVLHLLYDGRSVAQIAETLGVTRSTVSRQLKTVELKLEVTTKLAAVAAYSSARDEFGTG